MIRLLKVIIEDPWWPQGPWRSLPANVMITAVGGWVGGLLHRYTAPPGEHRQPGPARLDSYPWPGKKKRSTPRGGKASAQQAVNKLVGVERRFSQKVWSGGESSSNSGGVSSSSSGEITALQGTEESARSLSQMESCSLAATIWVYWLSFRSVHHSGDLTEQRSHSAAGGGGGSSSIAADWLTECLEEG